MRRHLLLASLLLLALASNAAAWRARIAGDAGWSASIQSLGVFANGDVAAIGSVQHAATVDDFLVMRFQARTGRVLWRLEIDGNPGVFQHAVDGGWDVAVARNGDVFAGGHIAGPAGDPDAVVLRLHGRTGRERWRTSFSLPNSARFDVLEQLLAHPSGDVVAIMYLGAEDGPDVVRVARLDGRNGAVRWQRDVGVGGCFHDCGGIDTAGNVVMAGRNYDFVADRFVARATSLDGETGASRWDAEVPDLNVRNTAYGADGAVVLGGTDGAGGAVVRLDRSGSVSWRRAFDGTFAVVDRVAVASDGSILTGGMLDRDVFAARLDAATGDARWRTTVRRDDVVASFGWPRVLAFADDRRGTVFAALPPDPLGDDPEGSMLALDGATGVERWRALLGRDLLTTLVRGDHGLVVGGGITNDDDLDPFEGVVVSRDGRRGTDAQGSKAHGAHGHVPPGHRVP